MRKYIGTIGIAAIAGGGAMLRAFSVHVEY